ncbi:YceK/YidQ family lipoprotein [Nissabacter sp. SGAir0207]|uniref:YceK/YidQ family lipoprotein n=1 Tax=Nissabacter sp. SGAir0207 TaxID=2126321 RepID=UPI0010F9D262|nr:YceK/YidQ family lipoprotein [Nissabacter sp. SGAir0207]
MKLLKVSVIALSFLLSGCGSLVKHMEGCYREYYAGTSKSIELGYYVLFIWLDVPFSAALDTVTLPIDAVCVATNN